MSNKLDLMKYQRKPAPVSLPKAFSESAEVKGAGDPMPEYPARSIERALEDSLLDFAQHAVADRHLFDGPVETWTSRVQRVRESRELR